MTVDALRQGSFADAVRRHRLIALLRAVAPQAALVALTGELADAGVRVFEIAVDGPATMADLEAVRARLAARGDGPFMVGVGGVLTRHQLEAARRAQADFAASPLLDESLVSTAVEEGLPFVPGTMTPTEIAAGWAAGATFLKLFPASAIGPSFLRDLRGPMPDPQLIPAGGIDASNAGPFLDAGAVAVGIGGAITRADDEARRALVRAVAAPRDGAPG